MKKYNVFKVLIIALLAAILVSFFIPQSTISYSGIEKGEVNPITFIDTLSNGLTSISVFVESFVYILMIGVFYAVLKKTGKYEKVLNNTVAKFSNKRKAFVIISVLTFGLLTAIIGNVMPMLIFVPAFIDMAKKLGYDSKKAILTTVGATIIGSAGSLYTNYANQILALKVSSNIIPKIIILVISLAALILFIILGNKKKEVKIEKEEVKKGLPIIIAFDVVLLLIILGMVPWKAYFGFEGFEKFHETLIGFKVLKVSLFEAVLGKTLLAFGSWTLYSLSALLMVVSLVLAIIYRIKVDGLFESISNGIKKSFPYALIYIIANVILVSVYNSGFYITVISSVAKMKDSILSSSTISALSSLVYPDYSYASQFTLSTIATVISNTAIFAVLGVLFQAIYSLMLLISPTSILLLMALKYEDVRYKDWVKYIYKFVLGLLIIYFMIVMIIGGKFVRTISYVVLAVLIVILVLFFALGRGKKIEITIKETKNEEKKEEVKELKKEEKKTTAKKVSKKSTKKK